MGRLLVKINQQLFRYSFTYLILRLANIIRLKLMNVLRTSSPKNAEVNIQSEGVQIYAPHGSFVIFTHKFIKKNNKFNYPMFLFGEEIYVAEKSREYNLDVIYLPDLVVFDDEHVSTSLMRPEIYRSYNYKALSYILRHFYF